MPIDQRIRDLGPQLPPVPTPVASYANAVRTGNLEFGPGPGPVLPDCTIPSRPRHIRGPSGRFAHE